MGCRIEKLDPAIERSRHDPIAVPNSQCGAQPRGLLVVRAMVVKEGGRPVLLSLN
jgi:hypothetical protein